MKRLGFILLLITVFQYGNAQEETLRSEYVIGGGFNFNSQDNYLPVIYINSTSPFYTYADDSELTSFSFNPYIGKTISSHFLVGIDIDYTYSKSVHSDIGIGVTTLSEILRNKYGAGIFGRYTFNPEDKFSFYLLPRVGYTTEKEEYSNEPNSSNNYTTNTNYMQLGLGAGVLYNINDRIRATLRIGGVNYLNGSWDNGANNLEKDFSSFDTSLNLSSLFVGFEIRL